VTSRCAGSPTGLGHSVVWGLARARADPHELRYCRGLTRGHTADLASFWFTDANYLVCLCHAPRSVRPRRPPPTPPEPRARAQPVGPGRLNDPHGVAVDAAGRVVVADRQNDRVQVRPNILYYIVFGISLGGRRALGVALGVLADGAYGCLGGPGCPRPPDDHASCRERENVIECRSV
jgi:hypothetical protein